MAQQRVIVRGKFNQIVEDRWVDANSAHQIADDYRRRGYDAVVRNS